MTDQMFMVMADFGSGPDQESAELFGDLPRAWAFAEQMRAEAAAESDDQVVYTVFELKAVERP